MTKPNKTIYNFYITFYNFEVWNIYISDFILRVIFNLAREIFQHLFACANFRTPEWF